MNDVFHHHQSAIDDDAEVQRSETEQVCRDSGQFHADKCEEKRKRNRHGGQDGGADATEEQEEHGQNDDEAFQQGPGDGAQRVRHQVTPVIDR